MPLAREASAAPPSAPAPRPPAASDATTYAVSACHGGTFRLTADELRALDLHNAQREARHLAPFCVDPTLTAAARAHASEMLESEDFGHASPNRTSFATRLRGFGYGRFSAAAENIAWGSGVAGAPDAVFGSWMSSAVHRANIENGALREIGIGVSDGSYRGFAEARVYTVDFGTH